jgi:cellobiose epimerase
MHIRECTMQGLRQRVENELLSNILPFWLKYAIDDQYGGFRGQIANDLTIDPLANKGLILNARILWTFSKAFTVYGDEIYRDTARRAYEYISRYFLDAQYGGVYWMLDYQGHPVETKKRIYGQAFTVYSLAEYHTATGHAEALASARQIYEAIERASHDRKHGGYFETYERDWTLSGEQRLSAVDMDEKKSMNTHLHVLEAYATLLKAWDDEQLRERLRELIRILLDHIIDRKSHHFIMFFDEDWTRKSDHISYGHDIEGSWLLCEAAEILGDAALLREVQEEAVRMAQAVYDEAIDADGGLMYEANRSGIIDTDKHWWPQAEAVVGFLNAYQLSGKEHFRNAAERAWEFIRKYIVDHKYGEWFWKVSRDGVPSNDQYKVDPWKCPYHNSRMCFEVMARLDSMNSGGQKKVKAGIAR